MPNYKLGVFKRGNLKKEIEDFCYSSLQSMDELTRGFENETELKTYLLAKEYISLKEVDYDMFVKYVYKKETKKTDIMYADIDKYFDLHYLRYTLLSYAQDSEFLQRLARYYRNDKFLSMRSSQIFYYLNSIRFNGGHHYYCEALKEALDSIFETTCLEVYPSGKDNTLYRYKCKRDFIMFMYKYEQKQLQKEEEEQTKNDEEKAKYKQLTLFEGPNSIL